MCGLFGFSGHRPDLNILTSTARLSAMRGPHAAGVGWSQDQTWSSEVRLGSWLDHLEMLKQVSGARCVIGHARLATSGSSAALTDSQPFLFDGGNRIVAHNGNVYNYHSLTRERRFELRSACDSELIGAMLAQVTIPHLVEVIDRLDTHDSIALLIGGSDGKLLCYSERLPLYVVKRGEGFYLSSVRFADDALRIQDRMVVEFQPERHPVIFRRAKIETREPKGSAWQRFAQHQDRL